MKESKLILPAVFWIIVLVIITPLALSGCATSKEQIPVAAPEPGEAHEVLTEHAGRFEKRIEEVTEGVYVAIGYALANVAIIVTGEGNIIVDTTESAAAAREIRDDFNEISGGPIRAIIYTHAHPDHIYGSSVFEEDTAAGFAVYAHALHYDFNYEQMVLAPVLNLRGARQFGSNLPEEYFIGHGIGPTLRFDHENVDAYVEPTVLVEDELKLNIGGQELILKHAPGETDDHLIVWLPDKKVLLPGDNYYPSFPNLYAIRGTPPRDVADWVSSLDKMRDLKAEYLVPGHGEPVRGASRVDELLTAYRDAIQYVHDAVIRGANEGKTPDELVAEIKLPPHLAAYPELRELYGMVSFSVRSIYNRYLGWFDGNATNLDPLPHWERSQKIAEMVGGAEKLLEEAAQALENTDYQWAAELADMVLALEPDSRGAREIKIEALLQLGEATSNTNARHYYFTQALELAGQVKPAASLDVTVEFARAIPLEVLFQVMMVNLDPAAAEDREMAATFNFTDTGEVYTVIVRRGVAELLYGPLAEADLVIHVSENLWKELAVGIANPAAALATGQLKVDGMKIIMLREFMNLFGGS